MLLSEHAMTLQEFKESLLKQGLVEGKQYSAKEVQEQYEEYLKQFVN